MSSDRDGESMSAGPGRWSPAPEAVDKFGLDSGFTEVTGEGHTWPLGTAADVAWISAGTTVDMTITSAIPPVFAAYATVVLPERGTPEQERHDDALLAVLRAHSQDRHWWLGYLDTGADDVVFPEAPRLRLYQGWPYVLVEAGPEQAAAWRTWNYGSFWTGHLPNLIFPADRSWLVSSLWDDDWTCLGGPAELIADALRHPDLAARACQVVLGNDATPPGHRAI